MPSILQNGFCRPKLKYDYHLKKLLWKILLCIWKDLTLSIWTIDGKVLESFVFGVIIVNNFNKLMVAFIFKFNFHNF